MDLHKLVPHVSRGVFGISLEIVIKWLHIDTYTKHKEDYLVFILRHHCFVTFVFLRQFVEPFHLLHVQKTEVSAFFKQMDFISKPIIKKIVHSNDPF